MEINYVAVLACSVLAMVVGYVWYGPLFGKKWLAIVGAKPADLAARQIMQQRVGPLYAVQFFLAVFQILILAFYLNGFSLAATLTNALWLWAGFVMPTVAGSAMWNNDSRQVAWARFLIQAGYQLVLFIIFGLVLGLWR